MPIKTKSNRFEDTFKELEHIVEELETKELDLEEGVKKFERGLELAEVCKKRLKEIENKVTTIKKKFAEVLDTKGGGIDRSL